MNLIQIYQGEIPEQLTPCMRSWDFCERKLYTEIPEKYLSGGVSPRIASNYYRIDLMIEQPQSIYADCDTRVLDPDALTALEGKPFFVPPYCDYCFGFIPVEFLQRMREIMGSPQDHPFEEARVYHAVKRIFMEDFKLSRETNYKVWLLDKSKYKDWFLPAGIIEHLNFSRSKA